MLVGYLVLFIARPLLGEVVGRILIPVYGIERWFQESESALPTYFRERSALNATVTSLEDELSRRSVDDVIRNYLESENEALRSQAGFTSDDRVTAAVIAQPPRLPYDVLFIDRGSDDGVVEGAAVYYGTYYALGVVSKVFTHTALVTLFSTAGMEATAYVHGPNIYSTTSGEGGGVVRVSVPQGVSLSVGDSVILPSLGAGVLGLISEVVSEPTQPEQYGYVVSPIPLASIRTVQIAERRIQPMSFEDAEKEVGPWDYGPLRIIIPYTSDYFETATVTPRSTN
ncbi:hypothetical protein KC727_02925 [Candidatus Kaiserbacteria bacterium]|nr:hypothetical protein [Candidatus Kaiserbacteria bacterium]